jgi:D-proline reductase (dithiol) PrdB
MVRLADLAQSDRDNMLKKIPTLPKFTARPWVTGAPLKARRVAIVTTAGLHTRGDRPFGAGAMDYRVIPGNAQANDLVMSHMSVNFDRTGFQQDWNVAFPLDRLRELARDGVIGSAAGYHYAFMGAVSPVTDYEGKAKELAQHLQADKVDAVLLSPV